MATSLTWLGHGSWLIHSAGYRILLDPFLTDNPLATLRADEVQADFVLISHGHYDHLADAEPIAKRTGATVIANFEICQWLTAKGVTKTHAMNIGGAAVLPFGKVKMTIAHHSSTLPDGASGGSPCGFLLVFSEGRVYFACDTGLFYDMRLIGEAGVDLAVLPIGDNFTMGPDDALEAVKLLRPKRVVPVHVNTWPVIAQDPDAWADRVSAQGIAEPIVLEPGEKIEL